MAAITRALVQTFRNPQYVKSVDTPICGARMWLLSDAAKRLPKQRLLSTSRRNLSDDKPKSKLPPLGSSIPKVSAREANKFIIDQLTARPGPGTGAQQSRKGQPLRPGESLPPEYKPAARRVVGIIVALPIVIVIGYMLFQRRFMGVERKDIRKVDDDSLLETVARPGVAGDEG